MNVQANESMNEAWAALQGHVVNSAFPLRRYLSGSEHTGVFLAESRRHKLPQVAIKLVRAIPARADAQLSRWLTADGLAHPHLIRIFEAGRCQLGGLQYLYAVMEYADQNLAELLEHRALTEDEAREMLVPTLSALAFLHERKYVQGQLKPSNILVVGDQLKLASDTIRRVGEATEADKVMSVYDPPEARGGSYWPAGDVWALGVVLCEALTRNRPVGLHDSGRPVAFPRDFPMAFREVVARCLSRRPHDRPSVTEIDAWLRGNQPLAAPPAAPAAPAPVAPKASKREVAEAAPKAVAPEASATAAQAIAREPSAKPTKTIAREAPPAAAKAAPRDVPEPVSKSVAREAPTKAGTIEVSEAVLGASPREATANEAAPAHGATSAHGAASGHGAASAHGAATPQGAATSPSAAKSSQPPVMTATASQRNAKPPSRRRTVVVTLAAATALALIWSGARVLRTQQAPPTPPAADLVEDTGVQVSALQETPSEPAPAVASSPTVASPISIDSAPAELESEATVSGAHEVLPEVPRRARQTIRGHVKVSVRVIVDPDGSVFAALVDDGGPSQYFARLAIEAAKKWTFAPVAAEGQRFVQVRFDFTREGTTARAVPLR